MSGSFQSDRERLSHDLNTYRFIVRAHHRFSDESVRDKKIDFWLESAHFWIAQLEICERAGDKARCNVAINKARECLDHLQELFNSL